MKRCPEPEDLALFVDGGHTDAESILQHLEECESCSDLLAELRADAAVLAVQPQLPAASLEEVRKRVESRLAPRRWRWVGAAAAAVLVTAWIWPARELELGNVAVAVPAVMDVPIPKAPPETQHRVARKKPVPKPDQVEEALMDALERYMDPAAAPAALAGDVVVAMQTADPDVMIILLPEGD